MEQSYQKDYQGLSSEEAKYRLLVHGRNELNSKKTESIFSKIWQIIKQPMFLLLLVAGIVYFILGETTDGAVMLVFVVVIISIEIYQGWKTDNTLRALRSLSATKVVVIRDGKEEEIETALLVPGDLFKIQEGNSIPADCILLQCNDLRVNEASLTGESLDVSKVSFDEYQNGDSFWRKDFCYATTLVSKGSALAVAEKTGENTEYGKIGKAISEVSREATDLEKQIARIVRVCVVLAIGLCLAVALITFINLKDFNSAQRLIQSLLAGIAIAMALIPEEFPVVLTVFLSLGAWRLARQNSLVRELSAVETLGAITVLCVDKTGTITENNMQVAEVYSGKADEKDLTEIMGLACETETYDPMEIAMLAYCQKMGFTTEHLFGGELLQEYSFTDENKMMGHVWFHDDDYIIAAKGSPETLLELCKLSPTKRKEIDQQVYEMSKAGLRVIAVAHAHLSGIKAIPKTLKKCNLEFCGLVGLADPPKENIREDIENCYRAKIRVIMITGDSAVTAASIAEKIGMSDYQNIISGEELEKMDDLQLRTKVKTTNIFSRVLPSHKMRIVEALKSNGETVAMTGDGVNDAAALKNADIGIAMGKGGSEVSSEAADLILLDDNFSTIISTIKDARRIYDNIKRAVAYILIIHLPIALSALAAPLLKINANQLLFLPVHVALMELIIDPTCSIVLERQPAADDIMERGPRDKGVALVDRFMLFKSLAQGLVIFTVAFGCYYYLQLQGAVEIARSMAFVILIMANFTLVIANAADKESFFHSFAKLAKDRVFWLITLATILLLLTIIYTPLNFILSFRPLRAGQFFIAIGLGLLSVIWYEILKLLKRVKKD